MPIYNLIEHSDNYSKSFGSLWQYCRDELDDDITDSESFRFTRTTGSTPTDGNSRNIEIAVPLKNLNNFWRTLEIPLIGY